MSLINSVALLFTEISFDAGISDINKLFHITYPSSILETVEYRILPNAQSIDAALDDYFSRYPDQDSNRSILSELTAILILIVDYLDRH
jgi:hypothetical protein